MRSTLAIIALSAGGLGWAVSFHLWNAGLVGGGDDPRMLIVVVTVMMLPAG